MGKINLKHRKEIRNISTGKNGGLLPLKFLQCTEETRCPEIDEPMQRGLIR